MTTVEVYYFSRDDFRDSDTLAISYVPLNNSQNTALTYLREADLYTESGIVDGKYLMSLNRYTYNNSSIYNNLTQNTISLFLSKGNLSGINAYANRDLSYNYITPSYQSGYYFGKNILMQIEVLDDNLTGKFTLFISDK